MEHSLEMGEGTSGKYLVESNARGREREGEREGRKERGREGRREGGTERG